MTYTPVPAIAAGDTIDEVFLNTYWVNNMAAMIPDMFSAKGQLAVGLGVDSMGVLNVGADDGVLTADSAQSLGIKWTPITQKKTVLEKSTTQSVAVGNNNPITWDINIEDDEGLHSTSVNNHRVTFVKSGFYMLLCEHVLDTTGLEVILMLNGATTLRSHNPNYQAPLIYLLDASAGDYVQVNLRATVGGSACIISTSSRFTIVRLGA